MGPRAKRTIALERLYIGYAAAGRPTQESEGRRQNTICRCVGEFSPRVRRAEEHDRPALGLRQIDPPSDANIR